MNPARTVTLNGATVPAVVVVENLPPSSAEPQPNTFYIEWGAADVIEGHAGNAPLMSLNVVVSYYSLGSVQSMVDRGRLLSATGRRTVEYLPTTEYREARLHTSAQRRFGYNGFLGPAVV